MKVRFGFATLLLLAACASLSAQSFQGTFTDNKTPGVHSSLAVALQVSGSRITGAAGVGQPGQIPVPSMPISGTYSGGICTITVQGVMTLTGPCNSNSFSGTYYYKVGNGAGRFTTTATRTALVPQPTLAPAPAHAPPVTPPAAAMACFHGYMTPASTSNYYPVLACNLQIANGRITGTVGIGQPGTTPPANVPVSGTVIGQTCSITVQGGMVLTGQCSTSSFSGSYSAPQANGARQTGTFTMTSCAYAMPAPPAPNPTTLAPTPAHAPPVTPPAAATACFHGYMTPASTSNYYPVLACNLQIANGRITGTVGIGQPGTTPPANVPVSGTVIGQTCSITVQGGMVMTGQCNTNSFSGNYTVPEANGATQTGTFAMTGCATTAPAPVPAPFPRNPPAPTPAPAPAPAPNPAPPVIKPPAPTPAPAPPQGPQTRFCGTFNNTTLNIAGSIQFYVNVGAPFSGQIVTGTANTCGTLGANCGLYGGGAFTGNLTGTKCNGATAQNQSVFQGTCDGNTIDISYVTDGQNGTMHMTRQACSVGPFAPGWTQPVPPVPVAPTPNPPVRVPVVPNPVPPAPNPPAPAPIPTPAPPVPAPVNGGYTTYCGSFNYGNNVLISRVQLQNGTFNGTILDDTGTWGNLAIRGTLAGNQCQGSGANMTLNGTCTATSLNLMFKSVIRGTNWTGGFNGTTQQCPH